MTGNRRIDTHQHIVPDDYARWLEGHGETAGGLAIPSWSAAAALDAMDANDVETGILSISTPGVHLGDDAEARLWARKVNEAAARVVVDHPGRFGFFATLTLPDVDGALEAAAYAFDELHADGVVLLCNVRGTYLGDPAWDPLMEELNRRKAVVFTHPASLQGTPAKGINPHVADFLLDTTRTAINIAKSGCLERYSDLKIILSHGGGFVPFAAQRIARSCSDDGKDEPGIARLRRFYYDVALAGSPFAMPSLLALADHDKITFGSDFPYAPKARGAHFTSLLDDYEMDPALRGAINRGNAETLFPRLTS